MSLQQMSTNHAANNDGIEKSIRNSKTRYASTTMGDSQKFSLVSKVSAGVYRNSKEIHIRLQKW